jgi:hypothetical protein
MCKVKEKVYFERFYHLRYNIVYSGQSVDVSEEYITSNFTVEK